MMRAARVAVALLAVLAAAGPAGAQTLTYAQNVAVTAMDPAGPTIGTVYPAGSSTSRASRRTVSSSSTSRTVSAPFGGAAAHVWMHPAQALPLVGASAAVSGMMAAAAWFMFAPAVWLPEGRVAEAHERPREHLRDLVRNRRVVIFLAVWLVANYVSAVLAQPLGITEASIAWEAHVGGFLVGLALFPVLDPLAPLSVRATA